MVTHQNINIAGTKKVLIAPLDWGLGHATRCVPVINELLAAGFEVIIAGDGAGKKLLRNEFPSLQILKLEGYNISYSKNKKLFFVKMLSQFLKINAAINREHKWLNKIIAEHKIDIVISDNRFGFYNKNIQSVFITHQLQIKTGNSFTEKIAQKINYSFINNFNDCWVADEPGIDNLAGELSHPRLLPSVPVKYLGALSRFVKSEKEITIDLLAVISGPEPQRTIFENILLAQMTGLNCKMVLVRGLPLPKNKIENASIKVVDHLPAAELNALMASAKTVVARSGYSTVMDLARLQKNSILIPTPGQTEQEYLAAYLAEKKFCITASQSSLNLKEKLKEIENTTLNLFPENDGGLLKKAINSLE